MLDTLPLELLNMILSNVSSESVLGVESGLIQLSSKITSHRDLKQICEVCTRLWDCATPHLYRCLVFTAANSSFSELTAAVKAIPTRYAKYIRELELRIPIHHRACAHCWLCDELWSVEDDASVPEELLCDYFEGIDDERTYGEISDDDCPFVDLMHALNDLQFLDDQLRSFQWNLGQCIPDITLSSNEFSLLRKQRKIESLIIHTDIYCDHGVGSVDLVQFPDLRSLSWKGLNKYSDFECLKDCIRAHDIWTDEFRRQSDEAMPDNFLVQRIMNPKAEDEKMILQSLKYLDLSSISFEIAAIDMPVLFNTENLRTLKLRKCIGSLKWLELVSSSGKLTELKSFELVLTNCGPIDTMKTICNFIERAPKLEILCLMLRRPINWESLISTICRCSSLTRLVMHGLADEGNQILGGEVSLFWILYTTQ
ncbi:hypothetical protein AAWM_03414 [Aspergillus awamori]|uniref:F-box domain-containing protein n=1 Tax=Aspergillus awamori TaxID=105351 RepID=A0A401KMP0_ASPAW|nr:hypothetical protein AAWM_03414 [Aspergillus awamori]